MKIQGWMMGLGLCVSAGALAAGQVDSVSIEEAKGVLNQYAAQSYLQSPQFVELYSDRATIRARVQGQPEQRTFQGRMYKQWVRASLQRGGSALDASQFKDVRLERRGKRLVIRANRYSANRCYWDQNYLLGLEREGGRWLIVDEWMQTQPQSQCSDATAAVPVPMLNYNSAINMGVMPSNSSMGGVSSMGGMPAVNVGAVTSLQAPLAMPTAVARVAPPLPMTLPPALPLPSVPAMPPHMEQHARMVAGMTPDQQAAFSRQLAQQMLAAQAQAGTGQAQPGGIPAVAAVTPTSVGMGNGPGLAPAFASEPAAVGNSLWVTPR